MIALLIRDLRLAVRAGGGFGRGFADSRIRGFARHHLAN